MPNLDEQLSQALREAAPRPTTSGLDQRLARRRRARAVRRRLGTAALAVVVLAGTAAGFLALSDAFERDGPPLDATPAPSPSDASPTPEADALRVQGVPFPVCRPMSIPADFGRGPERIWVFEEERVAGAGCQGSEGFQHVGIGTDERVSTYTGKIADIGQNETSLWPIAAPDVDGDGVDEIAIGMGGSRGVGRANVTLFFVPNPDVIGDTTQDLRRIEPVVFDCGEACDPVQWFSVGPDEDGRPAGTYCGFFEGHAYDPGVVGLVRWWTLHDPLLVHASMWQLDDGVLRTVGAADPYRAPDTAAGYPPDGTTDLCGSRVTWPEDLSAYPTYDLPSMEPAELCNASSMTGDVDGDGSTDLVTIGSLVGPDGCPSEGQRNRILTIDLDGDQRADVESDAIDCSTWCFPFAAVDVSGDGKAEIFVSEGHTAPPASAVIAVYALVDDDLVPVTFPDGTNRFPLVNSSQGYHGAYCLPEDGVFVTWHGETDDGGSLERVTYDFFELDEQMLRFESLPEGHPWYSDLPPVEQRGYEGVFCGVEVEPLG